MLQVENNFVEKIEIGSTLHILLKLATLKFVVWQVEHAVVIRVTPCSTCHATMLRHKLNENVALITWPLDFHVPFTRSDKISRRHC